MKYEVGCLYGRSHGNVYLYFEREKNRIFSSYCSNLQPLFHD